MKKQTKRIVSLFLAVVMVLSMLPVSVFAAPSDNLALNATVLGASGYVQESEKPSMAFDEETGAETTTKWCAKSKTGWIAFKTNTPVRPGILKVSHAKSSNNGYDKNNAANTAGYQLEVIAEGKTLPTDTTSVEYSNFLADNANWVPVSTVSGNTLDVSESEIVLTKPESVYRFRVTDIGVNEDAIRIYDISLLPPPVPQATINFDAGLGTGTMDARNVNQGEANVMPSCGFTAPEGQIFQKWEVVETTGFTLDELNNAITINVDSVTLKAVYAVKPDGTPTQNVNGTHTYSNGESFGCSVDHYEAQGNVHKGVCACGRVLDDVYGAHTSDGTLHYDGVDSHYMICDKCNGHYNIQKCTDFTYSDNGDGTHKRTCVDCGHEENLAHSTNNGNGRCNGDGTHTLTCDFCNADVKVEDCYEGYDYVPTADGKKHIPICQICDEPIPNVTLDHRPELTDADYIGNDEHMVYCRDCYEHMYKEKCIPEDTYSVENDNYCVKYCSKCGYRMFSTLKKHNLQYIEDSTTYTDLPYTVGEYKCVDCFDDSGNIYSIMYTTNPDKYLIQINSFDSGGGINTTISVRVNGVEHILDPAVDEKSAIEVNKTDEIVVTLNKGDADGPQFFVVDGADKSIVEFNCRLDYEAHEDEILWTNVSENKLANFDNINAILSAIPEDLSVYSPRSVLNLRKVLDKIPPSYTQDQNYVDEIAKELTAAVNGLVLKENAPQEKVAEIVLDDPNHSLFITETGYRINDGTEVPFTGRYVIKTDSGSEPEKIMVESGYHDITLDNVTLLPSDSEGALEIARNSAVYLNIKGENLLDSDSYGSSSAGIRVPYKASIYISDAGNGVLNVIGDDDAAGLGGNNNEGAGNITIFSGEINAKSQDDGAAIGGGRDGGCGTIKIYGGTVSAICDGNDGSGIGVGEDGYGGTIEIFGGDITARSDDDDGAGIGGADDGKVDSIRITGGKITASSDDGAAIGGGDDDGAEYKKTDIYIANAELYVHSNDGAGIGAGSGEMSNNITIIDTVIFADDYDYNIIGNDSSSRAESEIKLDNVTIFEKVDEDSNGNPVYDVNSDAMDEIYPVPQSLNGSELFGANIPTDHADGKVSIKLPNGKIVPGYALNGQIYMVVEKQGNENIDAYQVSDRLANYRPVCDAIDKIPEDLSIYTDESVAKLEAVVDAVDYTLAPERQAEVDVMAANILKAIDELVVREDTTQTTPESDNNNIGDNTVKSPNTGSESSICFAFVLSAGLGVTILSLGINKKRKKATR